MRARLAAIVLCVAGCGGEVDEGPRGASGVPASRHPWNMTAAETEKYCDWLYGSSGVLGRYDQAFTCHGYPNRTPTREQCLATRVPEKPGCTWTVANAEACALAIKQPCVPVPTPTECIAPEACR